MNDFPKFWNKLGFILILAHFPATWELKILKFSNFGQNHFSDFETPFLAGLMNLCNQWLFNPLCSVSFDLFSDDNWSPRLQAAFMNVVRLNPPLLNAYYCIWSLLFFMVRYIHSKRVVIVFLVLSSIILFIVGFPEKKKKDSERECLIVINQDVFILDVFRSGKVSLIFLLFERYLFTVFK